MSLGALGVLLRGRIEPDLSRRRLVRIHERSGGNPFFALELAGAWDDELPSSLESLVAEGLRDVPRPALAMLERVAVAKEIRHRDEQVL